MVVEISGLKTFGLNLDAAAGLARGKRRDVVRHLLWFGHFDEARDLLKRIVAEDPDGMLYRMWLVHAHLGCGEIDEADRLSEQLLVDFPDKQRVMVARASVLFTRGDIPAGREVWGRFANDPEEGYAYWARLGEAAQSRGEWNEARDALRRAFSTYIENQEAMADQVEEFRKPVHLWTALVMQHEHDGSDRGPLRDELDRMRRESEERVREMIAKPDPKGWRFGNRHPEGENRCPEPAQRERVVDAPVTPDPDPDPVLEDELRRLFGFAGFRRGQQSVIRQVLDGKSVLAIMPTGAGKSLCYQLPAMLLDGLTLVISPLIALMKDQVDGLPEVVQRHATLVNSSLESDEIERRMREIRAGKYKMVYAAPERLRQRPFLHALRSRGVSLFVVDEAHCVSLWGHDFRPDYLFIGDAIRYLGEPAVLAMTATATPQMRLEIANHFGRQLSVVSTGTHRPNLFLESIMVRSDEEKMRELVKICAETDGVGIVYTRSRAKTEELARLLRTRRIRATHYHARMEPEERTAAQDEFMDGRWRVICATVAFGMGVDKPDVRFVVHYSLPQSLENYYQEAGRAGRDGEPSKCTLLCTPSDKALLTRWMREERVDIGLPRECYRLLRSITQESPFAAVNPDDFVRDLGQDGTKVRVAISLLENVGLVKRHLDIPTTATLGITSIGAAERDGEFGEFAAKARLKPGQKIPFEIMRIAERAQISPLEVEEKLLAWQERGFLACHGSGRVMLIERLPAPKDAKVRLEDILSRYASVQERRVDIMFHYAESRRCKHDLIAEHFGEPRVDGCAACDNCAPRRRPEAQVSKQAAPAQGDLTSDQKRRAIIEVVKSIEGRVGFTGLVRVLKGSIMSHIKHDECPRFGILANVPKSTIERLVSGLIEEGVLVRDDGEYRLIWLGNRL